MLLIAELSREDAQEINLIAKNKLDAGIILNQALIAEDIRPVIKGLDEIPLGIFLKDVSEGKAKELMSSGCDFVVLDIKMPVAALPGEGIGKFLMIEPRLEPGLLRAINRLDIDGVFTSKGGESDITVEHLLIYQRLTEILDKPLVITLPCSVTGAELANLWQVGVEGIVIPPAQPNKVLAELRRAADNLPKEAKHQRGKVGVVLPYYGGAIEEEEEEEGI
jgi:hypothetical protein